MKRKHATPTPEASASQLLSELRETNGESREILAEYKKLLQDLKKERAEVEAIIFGIQSGVIGQKIDDSIHQGLEAYQAALHEAMGNATRDITDRLETMAASVLGVQNEIVNGRLRVPIPGEKLFDVKPATAKLSRKQ